MGNSLTYMNSILQTPRRVPDKRVKGKGPREHVPRCRWNGCRSTDDLRLVVKREHPGGLIVLACKGCRDA